MIIQDEIERMLDSPELMDLIIKYKLIEPIGKKRGRLHCLDRQI